MPEANDSVSNDGNDQEDDVLSSSTTLDDAIREALRLASTRDVRIRFEMDITGTGVGSTHEEAKSSSLEERLTSLTRVFKRTPSTKATAESAEAVDVTEVEAKIKCEGPVFGAVIMVPDPDTGVNRSFVMSNTSPNEATANVPTRPGGVLFYAFQFSTSFSGFAFTLTLTAKETKESRVKPGVTQSSGGGFIGSGEGVEDF